MLVCTAIVISGIDVLLRLPHVSVRTPLVQSEIRRALRRFFVAGSFSGIDAHEQWKAVQLAVAEMRETRAGAAL